MKKYAITCILTTLLSASACAGAAQQAFAGFDRNDYPGDAALPALRRDFRYTGYWLNNPPGEHANSWTAKRALLKRYGFGFLVLFNGRLDAQLKGRDAAQLGRADGKAAVAAAQRDGFAQNVLIFLDMEEGGRLLPEQAAYIFAWIDAVRAAGARAGVYCSGIAVHDESGIISTAGDIAARESQREQSALKSGKGQHVRAKLALWIADDACPPSPGCTLAVTPRIDALPADLRAFTTVWQYALSPRRMEFSAACPRNAAPDGNCYAPGLPQAANSFVDFDSANSPDPSEDR
ncbi:MAG TPA: glycoside hydrolase domain-containing protein [Terracidiphilus sp.]|jgi:hypothetical protein|nr:glycoside hydrolase domain-containing protein [Terracidiphilus sp.]